MKASGGAVLAMVLSSLALALSAGAAHAAPQGPWVLPAEDLSAPGEDAEDAQLAAGPDGTATAVWIRSDGSNDIIQAATRPPGGPFGAPVDLSAPGQDADLPQVVTALDGTTTAVWRRDDGTNDIIQAAIRPPGGSFGTPVDLSAAGQDANGPQVSAAPDGTTTAVWRRSNGANFIIQAATRPPGGSFGTPVDLSATGQSGFNPQIANGADGTATVVWTGDNGFNNIIQAATRPSGGSFGTPVDLSAPGQSAFNARVATATDGTATVVWGRPNGVNTIIQSATRPPGGSFGAPVNLSAAGQDASGPEVAAAPDGTMTAVWYRSAGSNFIVQAATMPPGGVFGAAENLSDAAQNAVFPQVAAAPDGTTTAIWRGSDGSGDIIQAATRPPGGSFGTPVDLSAEDAGQPQIATAPDGTTTAAWHRFNGSAFVIQSASTARPSPLLQVNRTGTGSGTVTSDPTGIGCGTDCEESFPSFTEVTLTATPDSGSTFTGWSGADCSGTGTCEVAMLEAATVDAEFTADPVTPAGEPKLGNLKITPKSRKAKRGRKAKFKVKVKNIGDAKAKKLKICAKVPKKLLKKPSCRKPGNPEAGKSKTATFRIKVKKNAKKGKKPKVTFTATATGVKKKTGKGTVKVK